MTRAPAPADPHTPVLLTPLLDAVAPVTGVWLDGTFGAGGYTRGLLAAGADRVIGIDRDPQVHDMAAWVADEARVTLVEGTFAELDRIAADNGAERLSGIVLDIGVSSMQLDQAERGFSFVQDGPLDMRMSQDGRTAADLVNECSEAVLADILYLYGEERAARRIARRIVAERPFSRTLELAEVISACLPRPKPGQAHPATRSFQALRIAVNDELGQLAEGLMAAERALAPGGLLAVVSFHSLEDRIVKRFMQTRSSTAQGNRYGPQADLPDPAFERVTRKAVAADAAELETNPRARSARLRVARRTQTPAARVDARALGLPQPETRRRG